MRSACVPPSSTLVQSVTSARSHSRARWRHRARSASLSPAALAPRPSQPALRCKLPDSGARRGGRRPVAVTRPRPRRTGVPRRPLVPGGRRARRTRETRTRRRACPSPGGPRKDDPARRSVARSAGAGRGRWIAAHDPGGAGRGSGASWPRPRGIAPRAISAWPSAARRHG